MKRPENEAVAPSLKKYHGGYHKGQVNDAEVEEMNDNINTGKGPAKPKSVVSARPKPAEKESYEVPVVIRGEEVSDTRRIDYGYEDPIKIQKLQQEGLTPDSQNFVKKKTK